MTNDACASTSGTWKSPYDGATWTQASDIDIDHMVPLKNAWIVSFKETAFFQSNTNALQSGAASWTTAKRTQFANDVTRPQLWAGKSSPPSILYKNTTFLTAFTVTDNVNQSKSDKSPDAWKPPLTSFYCTYAKSWVQVKSYWKLTITSAEKTALGSMLDYC